MKFTFKTEHPTGRYRSFFPSTHYIKYKKKVCGQIEDKTWTIRLIIKKSDINEDGSPDWEWIKLKNEFNTLSDAKQFLNENIEKIFLIYPIHCIDL